MKIVFLTHYFPPEVNAPAARTYEHCKQWVRDGHEITVVTCVPNAPGGKIFAKYKNRLIQKEEIDGITVVRVWSFLASNSGFFFRIINYISSMVMMVCYVLFSGLNYDRLIATSPQFFTGWAGVIISRYKKEPFILEIRDIWPESIVSVGAMKKSVIIRLLEKMEIFMYQKAGHIITVGNGYCQNIIEKGIAPEKISIITNGVDIEVFDPKKYILSQNEKLRSYSHHIDHKTFICSYIGTIGMAHGLEVVIRAAQELKKRSNSNIVFLIVGDGACKNTIEQKAIAASLSTVHFMGLVPKEYVPELIAVSDASLIHLRKSSLFTKVIPSKIFESMAMNVPIIMGVEGDVRNIVLEAHAGEVMDPENEYDLIAAIDKIKENGKEHYRGRAYVEKYFDRNKLAKNMLDIIVSVVPAKVM
jgi:glycosyltransferase involved in cell wall biosynthesis